MKNKELKNLIKSDITKDIPNTLNIDLSKIEIKEETEVKYHKRTSPKLILSGLMLASVILVFAIIFFQPESNPNLHPFSSKADVYSYSSISAVAILSFNENEGPNNRKLSQSDITEDEYTIIESDIKKYVAAIDLMVGNKLDSKVEEYNDYFNNEHFNFKITINLSIDTAFIIYYNTETRNKELLMTGMMEYDGKLYSVIADTETDDESTEFELEARSVLNKNDYVKVSQEIANDEQSFEYEIKTNGIVTESEIKLKTTEGIIEFTIDIENQDKEAEYEIKNKGNGEYLIEFEYKDIINNIDFEGEGTLKIENKNNTLIYQFIWENDESDDDD